MVVVVDVDAVDRFFLFFFFAGRSPLSRPDGARLPVVWNAMRRAKDFGVSSFSDGFLVRFRSRFLGGSDVNIVSCL